MGNQQSQGGVEKILQDHGSLRNLDDLKGKGEFEDGVALVHEALGLFRSQCPHLFQEALTESSAIADARQPDCPLVWVNDFFEKLTHYPKEEIVGKNCRFLQGPLTDRDTVRTISMAIKNAKPLEVDILNYRKDGVPFWNRFSIFPIFDNQGVRYFFAIQRSFKKITFNEIPYAQWGAIEVALFLQKIGLNMYTTQFAEEEISGADLIELSDMDLSILGMLNHRERDKFHEAVSKLKDSQYDESPAEDDSKTRAIKIYFEDKDPLVLVVNIETVDLVELTGKILSYFEQDNLQLFVSKSHRPNILNYVVSQYYEGPSPNIDIQTARLPVDPSPRKKEKIRRKRGKRGKKESKMDTFVDHPALRRSTTNLKVPEMINPTEHINYVENAPGRVEGLVEIGTTKNLVQMLKPMENTTLQVHARRSMDRDLTLMMFLRWMGSVSLPLVLLSKHHAILKINKEAMRVFGVDEEWAVQGMMISSLLPDIYETVGQGRTILQIGHSSNGKEAPSYDLKLSIVCEDCVCVCFRELDPTEDEDTETDLSLSLSEKEGVPIPSSIPSLPIQSSLLDFSASLAKSDSDEDMKKEQHDPNSEKEKKERERKEKREKRRTKGTDARSEAGAPGDHLIGGGGEKPLDLVSEMGLDRGEIAEKMGRSKGKDRADGKKKKRSLAAQSEAGDF